MRRRFYVLNESHQPIEANAHAWRSWFSENRILRTDELHGLTVNTSFVGVGGILFESVVFREWSTPLGPGFRPLVTVGTKTYEDAMKIHRRLLEETYRGIYDDE